MTEFEIKAKEMCESIIKHFETDTIYITDPFEYCYNLAKATMKVSPFEAPVSPKNAGTESEYCECPDDKFIDFVRYCGNCGKRIKFDED